MKTFLYCSLSVVALALATTMHAAVIEFDLSPPGATAGTGMSPLNEVIPPNSTGSGGVLMPGITFDTTSLMLNLSLGYGAAFGFTDLSASAFAWLLHGPSIATETAPVLFNLGSLHTFANDPSRGGVIFGSLTLTASQASDLIGGLDYINIYTPGNLGGEIRGQLIAVPEPSTMVLLFTGIMGVAAISLVRRSSIRVRSKSAPLRRE